MLAAALRGGTEKTDQPRGVAVAGWLAAFQGYMVSQVRGLPGLLGGVGRQHVELR